MTEENLFWAAGDQIAEVVAWLAKGEIDREASLLRALRRAPLPRKFVPRQLLKPLPGQRLELPEAPGPLLVQPRPSCYHTIS